MATGVNDTKYNVIGKKNPHGIAKTHNGGKLAWMVKEFIWKDRLEEMKGKITPDVWIVHTPHR